MIPKSKIDVPINIDTLFRHLGLSYPDIRDIKHIRIDLDKPVRFHIWSKIAERKTVITVGRNQFDTVARVLVAKYLLSHNIFSQNTKKRFNIVKSVYDTGVRVKFHIELY